MDDVVCATLRRERSQDSFPSLRGAVHTLDSQDATGACWSDIQHLSVLRIRISRWSRASVGVSISIRSGDPTTTIEVAE